VNHIRYPGGHLLWIVADVGLPDANDGPPLLPQQSIVPAVPTAISLDFGNPVGRVRAIEELAGAPRPISSMPEVTVAEYDHARCGKDDVRLAGKQPDVFPKPKALLEEHTPQETLMARVSAPIPFHRPRAC
jgi:hypothetical protein